MHQTPGQPQHPYSQQPQQWPPQQQPTQPQGWNPPPPPGPYGAPQLPAPRKAPWGKILLGFLVVSAALIALLVMAAKNAVPDFTPTQGRDVCALLLGNRTPAQVAEMTYRRFGISVEDARKIADEMVRRGCTVQN